MAKVLKPLGEASITGYDGTKHLFLIECDSCGNRALFSILGRYDGEPVEWICGECGMADTVNLGGEHV